LKKPAFGPVFLRLKVLSDGHKKTGAGAGFNKCIFYGAHNFTKETARIVAMPIT
jgi:hypothetical protein